MILYLDLNVLDWGANNLIAVALRTAVYLWNASTGSIQQMVDLDSTTEYVSSVSWSHDANVLAVGYSNGNMEVSDGLFSGFTVSFSCTIQVVVNCYVCLMVMECIESVHFHGINQFFPGIHCL